MRFPARVLVLALSLFVLTAHPAQAAPGDAIPAGSVQARQIRYEFAIYYPGAPATEPMPALRRLLKAMAGAPALVEKPAKQATAPELQAIWVTDALKSYAPPSLESLQYFGRGLSPEQDRALQKSNLALRLDFAHPSTVGMAAYRRSLQLTEDLARETNGLIWDEETRLVFTPEEWHKSRLLTWEGDLPQLLRHTITHAYPSGKLMRAITLGMAKFGLPDLVIDDFPRSSFDQVGSLINTVSQRWAEGATVQRSGEMDADLNAIQHRKMRESLLKSLKEGAKAQARLQLVEGTWEQGDPQNRLVEIRFGRYEGPDLHARQEALFQSMFGSADSVSYISHSSELQAASRAAVAKLPMLRDRFRRGLKPGEIILVKAPFKTTQDGTEWMWVEVTEWNGEAITGTLQNTPFNVPSLRAGQLVKVSQSELFDYIHRDADGKEEGNTTGAIIAKMQDGKR